MESKLTNSEKFLYGIDMSIRGFQVAERIVSNDLTTHYLILNRHIGDVMRQLKNVVLFKEYYSKKEGYVDDSGAIRKPYLVKKVIVLTNRLNAGVARLYNTIDDVIILEQQELDDIGIYAKSIICVHKNLHRDEYGAPRGYGYETADHSKSTMFGIGSYPWVLDIPQKFPNKNEWIISSIGVNKKSKEEAYQILKSIDANPKKTVILCPHAKSTSVLDDKYWELLSMQLHKQGYTVFTNVGPKEKEIQNTLRLEVSVDVYVALGVIGCIVIGVQSGILDVARWAISDIRLLIIHYLKEANDTKVARNRKLDIDTLVQSRLNNTHLLLPAEKIDNFPEILKSQFSYLDKGNYQKDLFDKIYEKNFELYQKSNLNDYVETVKNMDSVILFLSVCDSADKYWNLFEKESLGLTADLSETWRRSYIAIVDKDNDFIYEKMNPNYKEVAYQGEFQDLMESGNNLEVEDFPKDNHYYLTSHAMGKRKYTKSAIVINGIQYSQNQRGLNIVVFSKKENCVIDSISVDMWADETLTIKRS